MAKAPKEIVINIKAKYDDQKLPGFPDEMFVLFTLAHRAYTVEGAIEEADRMRAADPMMEDIQCMKFKLGGDGNADLDLVRFECEAEDKGETE